MMRTPADNGLLRSAAVALSQATFSATSIAVTIAISAYRTDAKTDLAFTAGMLLLQGLARIVIGYNLPLDNTGSAAGALWLGFVISLATGVAFQWAGYWHWVLCGTFTISYEICRSAATRSPNPTSPLLASFSDLAWMTPVLFLSKVDQLHISTILTAGATLATAILCLSDAPRTSLRQAARLSDAWIRSRWARIRRSAAESVGGIVVPFCIVAALTAFSEFDDANGLRAAAQVLSPQGSAVGILILLWPRVSVLRRRRLATTLTYAPLVVPGLALATPQVFTLLSAGSPSAVSYAFGWAGFGCAQTWVALSNAAQREGPADGLVRWSFVWPVSALLLTLGMLTAQSAVTRATIALAVLVPALAARMARPNVQS